MEWLELITRDKDIMKRLLTILLAAALVVLTPAAVLAKTGYTTDKLRIRKTPSTKGDIVTVVPANTALDVVETGSDGWAKINFNGKTCYAKAEYISMSEKKANESAADTSAADTSAQASSAQDTSTQSNSAQAASTQNAAAQTASAGTTVSLDPSWKYADYSAIHSGAATLYKAKDNRKDKVIGVNAGHGTSGGTSAKTWCHPDKTAKVTGGSTAKGATQATAVSSGMTFNDGTAESAVTLKEAQILRDLLLANGYDVLMLRDSSDVQLDNVARTVLCNNLADCHIAIHWDGDGLSYDKGCFYSSVPDGIKYLETVSPTWEKSEKLGDCLISGLKSNDNKIRGGGSMDVDLTQTSYSTVPSVDIELGNQCSDHSDAKLTQLAKGLLAGINQYFGY